MAYPISDVPRRIVYSGSAGVGPYAFTFEVLANTDIAVYKNTTLLTLTTDYTVSINTGTGTGTVTLVVAATGADTVTIVGDRAIQRTSDFVTGGDLFANTLNEELDAQTIYTQQVDEKADRAIRAPVTDPTTINMVLPSQTTRASKVLGFNAQGNPTQTANTLTSIDAAVTAINEIAAAPAGNAAGITFLQAGASAVTRTAQSKMRDVVSALDYGADPTGTLDSSQAIQNAINEHNVVHIPPGTYRCDNSIIIQSSYSNRKFMTMTAATKLRRMSAFSAQQGPVIELIGNYGHFDGGFGEIESENDSPRGVVVLGQRDTNLLSTGNGLFWSFNNCDVRCKDYQAGPTPTAGQTIGIYIPSAQPYKGATYANYFGSVSNVRVFRASTAYWLTDQVNAHTFVNCTVEYFWHYAWKLNGSYGHTIYGGFVNACYQNGGTVVYLGNREFPTAPYATSLASNNNSIFGIAIELYTTGNYGVYIPAPEPGGLSSAHNFVQINWNTSGTPVVDLTGGTTNTIYDGLTTFRIGENLQMPDQTASGYNLVRIGTTAYTDAHAIAKTAPVGGPVLVVENLNTAANVAAGLQVRWNTPTIGYSGAIISAYHSPTAATRFKVIDNGDCQNTNGVYAAISDAKLKDVIGDANSQWDDVKFLAGKLKKYSLKDDPQKLAQLGWVAQEIEATCPGLVFETPDVRVVETVGEDGQTVFTQEPTGEFTKGIRYSIASLKAFKALGEAIDRIEMLEAKLAVLEAKV